MDNSAVSGPKKAHVYVRVKSLTDEINDFDNVISPMERNIKWFVETAECRLVARDQTGKIKS